jgi:hypothetical protein
MSRVRLAGGHRHKVLAALTAAVLLALTAVIITVLAGRPGTAAVPGPGTAADSAGAASTPAALPVVYAQVAGWHDGRVRPAAIYVGEGGAPYVQALRWLNWTATGAQANGGLRMQSPGCTRPAYQCRYQRFSVNVALSQVQTRNGVRYYALMRWTYTGNHVRHVIRWTISRGFWRN